ncbi:MAG TPA: ABC-type transport auxiliary lipoprotein family protein [Steroidobacteraceae bacterium]|nr:ABC-type transport auxiliary lipoprotein family protein [Steroidobacteraceae bacterium]
MSRVLRGAVVALLAVPLAACSLRSAAPPVQSYVLAAPPAAPGHPEARPASAAAPAAPALQVLHPLAAPGLDTDAIVVRLSGGRLNHYAGSRWAVPLPDLVEALTVQALGAASDWSALEGSRGVFPAPYLLQLTIRRFDAEYGDGARAPVVHVLLEGALVRRADRAVLGDFRAEGSAAATEDRLGAVVAAFQQASNTALESTAARARQSLQNSDSPSASSKR